MKRFREKHPLLASLMILAVMFAGLPAGSVLVGIAVAIPPLTEFLGDYGIQLLAELSMLVVMVLMTFLWKMERVFTCPGQRLRSKSASCCAAAGALCHCRRGKFDVRPGRTDAR